MAGTHFLKYVGLIFLSLMIVSCGGGGGGDKTPPVVTAPTDITVEAINAGGSESSDSTITAFLAGSSATDNIDSSLNFSHNAPTTFPLGASLVTFSYTDTSGNTGTATATVNIVDTIAPIVTAPADISVEASDTTTITTFLADSSAVDTIDPAPTLSTDAPSTFPLGNTIVTFTYTDTSGNAGIATAIVTAIDTTAPVITAPTNIVVEAASATGTPISNTNISTFLSGSSALDAVDPAPAFSNNAPAIFPLGATVVTFTYTDANGNTGTDISTVTIVDTTNPVVTAPANITVEAASAAGTLISNTAITTFLAGSSAIDTVDPAPLFSHDGLTTFPLGATVVTFTYTDTTGNVGTDTATVTIVDTTNPVVTAPTDITVEAASADGTAASNTAITTFLAGSSAIDTVDPAPVFSHDGLTVFPLGATVVTFTYTDTDGNVGTDTAIVTIVDTTSPIVTAPTDITVEAESAAGTSASNAAITSFLTDSSALDAVNPFPSFSHDGLTTFPLGITDVTFTYTDAAGNAGTDIATVTVVDTTAPVITLVGNNPLTVDLNSTFTDPGSTVADTVSTGLTATVTGTVDTLTVGVYILSYDVTDAAGNIATTVTRTVNVEVVAPSNVSFTVSGKHLNFTWDANTALDHSRILVNPDGSSGFTIDPSATNIEDTATGFSLEVPVHLIDWVNAQFIVEACDVGETQCKSSPNQTLSLIDSIAATVFVKASNTNGWDSFGWSVAISGDGNTLAVGAYREASAATGINGDQLDNTASDIGAVYIFVRSGLTWVQQAYIKASNAEAIDRFGHTVSLSQDGNTLAVGAYSEASTATGINGDESDNSGSGHQPGAVYTFVRTVNIWSQQAYIKASTYPNGHFGWSISLSSDGNTLAVGAYRESGASTGVNGDETQVLNTSQATGAAYVFTRSGNTWSQQAYIKASNPGPSDYFGWSVSISGDGNTLAVGAYQEDSSASGINGDQNNDSMLNSGAVYIFSRTGSTWSQQAYIKATNLDMLDLFGHSVVLSANGNTLAVGATEEDSSATGANGDQSKNDSGNSGAVYVYTRSGTTWSSQSYLKASNTSPADNFGYSLSISDDGDILVVGTIYEDSDSSGIGADQSSVSAGYNAGAVYLFKRNIDAWLQHSYIKSSNSGTSDLFGQSVSLNADGNFLAVGAYTEDSGSTGVGGVQDQNATDSGAVYLY
jgi:trimeric autotransporter adhesin